MQNYLYSGVPTRVWANDWVWEVQHLDPDTKQLWHILNHKYSRSLLVCIQQVRKPQFSKWGRFGVNFCPYSFWRFFQYYWNCWQKAIVFTQIYAHRHTLALGLTLVESHLDKLSAWNQGLIAHFLEKVENLTKLRSSVDSLRCSTRNQRIKSTRSRQLILVGNTTVPATDKVFIGTRWLNLCWKTWTLN